MYKLKTQKDLAIARLLQWITEAPTNEDQLARVQFAKALLNDLDTDESWDIDLGREDDTNHPPEDLISSISPNWARPQIQANIWQNTLH